MFSIIPMLLTLSQLPANARSYDFVCHPTSGTEMPYRDGELVQTPVRVKSKKGRIKVNTTTMTGYIGSQKMSVTSLAKDIYNFSTEKIPASGKILTAILDVENGTFTLTSFKPDGPRWITVRQIYGDCAY